jgi:hypothetical protein
MAEETEKILVFSIELDLNQFEAAAKQAEKDLEALLTQQAILRERNEQGTAAYNALSVSIQRVRKDLKDNAAAIETVKKIQKENTGSIKEMRQELSVATLQYNNLSKAERENANVGGKLRTQIKALSDDLKKNGQAIGDNRMNVGNYKDAISQALNQTNLFGGGLSQIAGLMSSGGVFGAALIGIIGAFKGLDAAISITESGAESLERRISGNSAAFEFAKGSISSFAESVKKAFDSVGLGNITGGAANLLALITGGKKGLEDAKEASKLASDLTGKLQDLDDAQRGYSTTISENNVLIDQYIIRAKNRTLSDQERLDLLSRASSLEEQNLEIETNAAETRLGIIQGQNELLRRAGTLRDEDKQKEVDVINEINRLRQGSLSLQERIISREDAIREERQKRIEADNEKEIQAALKKQQELQKIGKIIFVDDYKNVLNQRKETTEVFNAEEELAIKERYANGLINERQFTEQMVQVKAEGLQRELDLLEINNATELGLDNEIALKKIEIATFLADSQIKENERVTKEHEVEVKKRIEQEKQYNEITTEFIGELGVAFGESLTQQGLDVEKFGQKVILVVLDTLEKTVLAAIASATAQSYAQADSVTTYGATGTARAAILAGLITAAFEAAKASIANSSFEKGGMPRAERGMIIGGKRHSQGGTKFYGDDGTRFEAEKDEAMIILNRRATDRLRYYSSINAKNGGVDFYKGNHTSTYLQDGGFAARAVSASVDQSMSQQQLMSNLPPLIVLVEDINSAQGNLARVKSKAQF